MDGRDMVTLRSPVKIKTFKSFIKAILNCSHSPFLYNHAYFEDYLDSNIFMSVRSLEKFFPEDNTSPPAESEQTIVTFPVKDLLQNGETFQDILPTFASSKAEKEDSVITLKIEEKRTYSMRQILFLTITSFLKAYLAGNEEFHEHVGIYNGKLKKFSDDRVGLDERRKHFELAHKLSVKLIRKFEDEILDYQKELKNARENENTGQPGEIADENTTKTTRRKRNASENQTTL
jgi:hypothetical protein